ncbi:MAG TPA: sigma-54 dependent transcriptional regulator, partial [Bacteroidia bacterium]|nr:sigma-54 dependent transcriptional regulator [Bacteroidia bacterium]
MPVSRQIRIFVVEDNDFYRELLKYNISLNPDYEVTTFSSGKEMLESLYLHPHIITLDFSLPDFNGDELLKRIKVHSPDLPVIVISNQEDVKTAVELLRAGAYDYITKDEDTRDRLHHAIQNICKQIELRKEVDHLKEELGKKYEFGNVIQGNSPAIRQVFGMMEKAAKTNITVSVSGETGTGKELVAKAIHYHSDRKSKPFVAVNVAAIPRELLESELFGHEKGAFTGALVSRAGKFEEADGGTLFLDEIGEMDFSLQAKLLRILQEREVSRVGSNKVVKIDVRVIIATHKNLQDEVRKGTFREDLYYRLLGLPIFLPPLRDRGHDVLIIAKHLLDTFCRENKMSKLSLTPEAQNKLSRYFFPGNIRELKAIVEL